MNINRHNYEEFFLLYVDHELSGNERAAVELFVQENPDLREELKMLEQAVLRAEKKVVFEDKASLLKPTIEINLINESNCEEYFILYGDDELTNEEKDAVEQFVYKNPQHQVNFELFQQARLSADNSVVFPDKKSLYRSEEDEKVVVIRWWRIAAAAAIILMIGTAALYFAGIIGKPGIKQDEIASKSGEINPPEKNVNPVAPNNTNDNNNPIEVEPNVAQTQQAEDPAKRNQVPAKKIIESPKETISNPKEEQQLIAEIEKPKKVQEDSNPVTSPNVIISDPIIAKNNPDENAKLVATRYPDTEVTFDELGKNDPTETQAVYASNNNGIEVLNTTVSNKGKMRGFFRKVGRVVDKATSFGNIAEKDTDKKGVRIANFEIALK